MRRYFWWDVVDKDFIYWIEGFNVQKYTFSTGVVSTHATFTVEMERVGDASDSELEPNLNVGRIVLKTVSGTLGNGAENGVFVYQYTTNEIVTHQETLGATFGDELFHSVDGITPEPIWYLEFGGGGDDSDFVALTWDATKLTFVDRPNALGGSGYYNFNGTLIGLASEAANHGEMAQGKTVGGDSRYSLQQTMSAGNTGAGDIFDTANGFQNRDFGFILSEVFPTASGWTFTRSGHTNANFTPQRPNTNNPTQFSGGGNNPNIMAGTGYDGGATNPWFGVYMILASHDLSKGEASDYIDRVALAQISSTNVNVQAQPFLSRVLADGSMLALYRTNHYSASTSTGSNTFYLSRIWARLSQADHDHVMTTGTLP